MTSATCKRIFVECDLQYKNSHSFVTGEKIALQRQFDNFDRKYTQPVNGTVIDANRIPKGAEVLLHHNACHDTYRIFDYKELGADSISDTSKYFSVPEDQCYAWRIGNGNWNPAPGFELGLRLFNPYTGFLSGMLPTQIKNKLLITSGELCGKVVLTKGNCDYNIIFQDKTGREGNLIRLRHFPEPDNIREEIVGIDYTATEKVQNGEYLVGISPQDAKQINVLA